MQLLSRGRALTGRERLQLHETCADCARVSFTPMPRSETLRARQRLDALGAALPSSEMLIQACDEETLMTQTEIARVAAPTDAERERALVIAHTFEQLGYVSRIDSAGNVIASSSVAKSDETRAPVVCMAHLDTVFDANTTLVPMRTGARVACPGIGDNSRGLAVMLTLARVLRATTIQTASALRPIEYVATVGEEGLGNLRGARAYFANRTQTALMQPEAVLVLDGPGDENIVHHALGSRRYRITFCGTGGHSWVDFGAPNAVHAAGRAVAWLAELPRRFNGNVALTVSNISGGESMNAIPSHATVDVDVRATEQRLLARVDDELRAIAEAAHRAECTSTSRIIRNNEQLARAASAFQHHVTLLGERPCGVLPREHELVQLAEHVSRRYNIEPISAIASTDANIPLSLGIPAITIGGGGTGGGAHTIHEWYDNTLGPRGVSRAFAILAALAA